VSWLLRYGRWFLRAHLHRRFDIRVEGVDYLPRRGPAIVVTNHIGYLDGPLVAAMSRRPVHVLTKHEMYRGRTGHFLTLTGQIPVHRGEPDPAAVRSSLQVLREGKVLGVFPEGGRGAGDLASMRPGAAYFALATGATVVPATVLGTRLAGGALESIPPHGSRLVLWYGPPLTFAQQPWPRRTVEVREATARIRNAMLDTMRCAQDATGMELPGPVPEGASS